MRSVLIVLGTIILLIAIVRLLYTVLGLLISIAVAAAVIALIVGIAGRWIQERRMRKLPHIRNRRAEKAASRAMENLERNVNQK